MAIGATAAAIPWLNQPPPDPIVVERPRIEAAMGEYRTAYRNRNLAGVVEVFPELPAETRRAMERAFTNCLVYEVTFDVMNVTLAAADPNSAEVDLRSTHECTPNSGGPQTDRLSPRGVFTEEDWRRVADCERRAGVSRQAAIAAPAGRLRPDLRGARRAPPSQTRTTR